MLAQATFLREDELLARHGVGHGLPALIEEELEVVAVLIQAIGRTCVLVPVEWRDAVLIEVGASRTVADVTRQRGLIGVAYELTAGVGEDLRGALDGHALHADVVLRAEELVEVVEVVGTDLSLEADLTEASLTALGGDEDHPVIGTSTVDSRSPSVLHDLHGLDVLGVDVIQTAAHLTVDDDQRRARAVEVGPPTQYEGRCRTWATGGLLDTEPRDSTREGLCGVGEEPLLETLVAYGSYGVGHLATQLTTAIGCDDHLIRDACLVDEAYGDRLTEVQPYELDLLRLIADTGDGEDGLRVP